MIRRVVLVVFLISVTFFSGCNVGDLESRIDNLESNNSYLASRIDEFESNNSDLESRIDDLESTNSDLEDRIDDLEWKMMNVR